MSLQTPCQHASYTTGKAQIHAMLSAALQRNRSTSLRDFHDRLELDGNLPINLQMHDCGLASLPTGFANLHPIFPGVASANLARVAGSPDRVAALPGSPPGGAQPVMFSGYVNVTADGDRSLFYLLVHSTATAGPPRPGSGAQAGRNRAKGRDAAAAGGGGGDKATRADEEAAAAADGRAGSASVSVPIIVWLQGGNGCSSLIGAFSENGPYYSPDGTNLAANPGSWHQLAHMLFLDRPAGAGYSFSRSGDYGMHSGLGLD